MTGPPPAPAPAPVRVGIVGPLLGVNPGWVTTQGEVLAEHLAADGVAVRTTSGVVPRLRRAVDVARSVRSWRGEVDVVVVLGFSGPALAPHRAGRAVRPAPRRACRPCGCTAATSRPRRPPPRRVRRVLAAADRLVAPSPYLARLGASWASPSRSSRTCCRRRRTPRAPPPGRGCSGCGRSTLYRPELAIGAFTRVHAVVPTATLTMAGQDKGRVFAVARRAVDAAGPAPRCASRLPRPGRQGPGLLRTTTCSSTRPAPTTPR